MSRVSQVPERYLATAKKKAIRYAMEGEYMSAYSFFEEALLDHPQFAYHPSLEKTHEIVHGLLDGKITDKNVLIQHILKDF
jgi:hypothetical protein